MEQFDTINKGCIFANRVSSWCNPATGDPTNADRHVSVSYGFINLYTSHPTHIPQIPSVTS